MPTTRVSASRWLTIVFAVLFSALFIVSAFPLANGAYNVPTATSSASAPPETLAQFNASPVQLTGGYTLPNVTNGELDAAMAGGPLASALQGPKALMALDQHLAPAFAKEMAALPASTWAALEAMGQARLHGASPSVIYADVQTLSNPCVSQVSSCIFVSGAVLAAIVIIGCTTVVGCVAGLAIAGLIIAVSIIVNLLMGNGGGNCGRCDAALQDISFLGDIHYALETDANATRTILNDLNTTYVALSWEAASAALAQLPNATFNYQLDALQSGILPQLESTIEGVIGEIASAVSTGLQTAAGTFGPNGYYGLQGYACVLAVGAGGGLAGAGQGFSDPNLYQGYANAGPYCYSETGSPSAGNEMWGGNANPSLAPGAYPGIRMQTGLAKGEEYANAEYFVQHGARFDSTWFQTGESTTSGPYVGTQFIPVTGTGVAWYNYTETNGAWVFNGPNGTYYVNTVAGCASAAFSTCRNIGGGVDDYYLIGVGTMPLNDGTASGSWLATSYNLTGPATGAQANVVPIDCGAGTSSQLTAPETDGNPVQVCDPSTNYTLTEMSTLLDAALNVGDAYWAFLRGQGYTSEGQVPTRCVIPNPADIIAPNVLGGAAYLASLNATALLALYIGYMAQLSYTFNETQNLTNGSFGGFCGHQIKCPTPTGSCVGWGIQGLGNAPVIALGSIYVPPTECEADLGQACHGETIANPKSWPIVNTQMFWEPGTGTLSLVLNQSMELPYSNPSQLLYTGNNSTGSWHGYANLTCATGSYNALGCHPVNQSSLYGIPEYQFHVTGNSSVPSSSIFPAGIELNVGPGWITRVSACADLNISAFNGNWATNQNYTRESGVCSFNETVIQSWITNATCLLENCGQCPPNCPPPPPGPGVQCPGTADLWIFGSIVNGVAGVFSGIPFIGTGLGCFVGYVVLVLLFVLLIYLAVVVFRAVRGRGG